MPNYLPLEPGGGPLARPHHLPITVRQFAGRAAELEFIHGLADQANEDGHECAMVIIVAGMAGVGKTTLALHLARQIGDRFPDGQMYVNMRGFDEESPPMTAGEALTRFLENLGVPPKSAPANLDEQAGLFRSLLDGKRVLIVLDNVRDASQVRHLLPASSRCLVLVTSRNQLTGLAAEGARVVRLQPFTRDEARELLRMRLGRSSVDQQLRAADELIRLCDGLPLALSVAAAHAATHPGFPLEALVTEFRNRSLDLLDTGDPGTTARTVFSWSYQHLSEQAARVFRLLSLQPGQDIGLDAASSLTAAPVTDMRKALDELTRAHLLNENMPGRFAFHDLLRAYATEQLRSTESCDAILQAERRLLDYYLQAAYAATHLMYPARWLAALPESIPGVIAESFHTYDEALA